MACDLRLKPRQTISERAAEVRKAVERLAQALQAKRVTAVVDRATGAIVFKGWDESSKDGLTDACAFRTLMRTGDSMTRELIKRAEHLAGRPVNQQAITAGGGRVHSHDNGQTWHKH
jgi:hypothetical protein